MKRFLKHLFIFLLMTSVSFLVAEFVLAQAPDVGQQPVEDTLILPDTDPRMVAARIVQIALGFLGILAVALIVYAGYIWMTSAGNADRVEKAKNIIKNAVIGLVIILSAFAIVSFIIAQFTSTSPGGGSGTSPGGGIGGGTGALGSCSLESVYPEPNQKEVPRNTSIIMTFREKVDSSSVCNEDPNDNNEVCDGENIRADGRIKIYQSEADPSLEENWLSNVSVQETDDHKTFVLIPEDHLGSPSEFIWYTVYLSNDIRTRGEDGQGVFTDCNADYYNWQFEVSDELDLEPPRVKEKGMFPPPDNEQDNASTTQEAQAATGEIEVAGQPDVYSSATSTNITSLGDSPSAQVEVAENCTQDGTLEVVVASDGLTAQLQQQGTLLGESSFSGTTVDFPGVLSLTVTEGSFEANDSWEIEVQAMQEADTLTVGNSEYTFVASSPDDTQIETGVDTADTTSNISSTIDLHSDIDVSSSGSVVDITATVPGEKGNNITLSSSDESSLNITEMSGGQDQQDNVDINDKEDQPRNSIIQVNFNEAVNPITVSGQASDLSDYIRVKCLSGDCSDDEYFFDCDGGDRCVKGEFLISNQYSTVEFRSNNQCGTNACGQPIYCLPGDSNLTVKVKTAELDECENDEDCLARAPYSECNGDDASVPVCVDDQETATTSDDINYPMADNSLMNGLMDVALNSLDGNRNGEAEGPVSYFDQNTSDESQGDNYKWSFFINDKIKIDPPKIDNTDPSHEGNLEELEVPIDITFNGLMMSDSLSTGSVLIGGVEHKLINLWNYTDMAIGYWMTKDNVDTGTDSWPDVTRAHLEHMMLDSSITCRTQAGSGVLDIYQNCFKPSDGPACDGVSETQPSCSAGTAVTTTTEEGNCPE